MFFIVGELKVSLEKTWRDSLNGDVALCKSLPNCSNETTIPLPLNPPSPPPPPPSVFPSVPSIITPHLPGPKTFDVKKNPTII